MEPACPVHGNWVQLVTDNIKWQPACNDNYNGQMGGPKAGPARYIVDIVSSSMAPEDIFFGILPQQTVEQVRDLTHKYCCEDFVMEREQHDRDGVRKKKKMLVDCEPDTPGARHHVHNNCSNWNYSITTGFIVAWFAILILQGAHFDSDK